MDKLGERIIQDQSEVAKKRSEANQLELQAARLRREADEIERLLNLARAS